MVAPVFDSEQTLSDARKSGIRKKKYIWFTLDSFLVSLRLLSEDYQPEEDTKSERYWCIHSCKSDFESIWSNISGYPFTIWVISSIFLPGKLLLRWLDGNPLCWHLLIVLYSYQGPSRECFLPPGRKYNCLSYYNEFAISKDFYIKEIALCFDIFFMEISCMLYTANDNPNHIPFPTRHKQIHPLRIKVTFIIASQFLWYKLQNSSRTALVLWFVSMYM